MPRIAPDDLTEISPSYGRASTAKAVFNVGWGHPETTWDDPHFQTMMLEGIKWAMGVTQADVTPRPFQKSAAAQAAAPAAAPPQAAMSETAAKDPLPEDVGKSTVQKICGDCHAIEQAISVGV